ncbi:MAG: hypothetical protein MJD61_12700 [Proteobacteria bacterium]|nr:hypothetical protein [Pseudomonadota bacterium]
MLPPFIIEQIRKREEKAPPAHPFLELPLPVPLVPEESDSSDDGEGTVTIVDPGDSVTDFTITQI